MDYMMDEEGMTIDIREMMDEMHVSGVLMDDHDEDKHHEMWTMKVNYCIDYYVLKYHHGNYYISNTIYQWPPSLPQPPQHCRPLHPWPSSPRPSPPPSLPQQPRSRG